MNMKSTNPTDRAAKVGVSTNTAEMVMLFNDLTNTHREILRLFDNQLTKESSYKSCAAECFAAYRDAVFALIGEMVADSLKHNPLEI